jgi:aspartate racemase
MTGETTMPGPALGVLGGMGPLAGAQFMVRLTQLVPAERDQDHVPALLWSDPRVPDRTAGRRPGAPDPLPALLRGVRGLAAAGCGAICVPCNTAHGWFDEMRDAASPVPVLHIVDAAAADLARQAVPPGPVGLLATAGTLAMRLYPDRFAARGIEVVEPSAEAMAELVTPAIAAVKAGRVRDAYAPLAEAARDLMRSGAVAVVLGCTEIPLGIASGPALPFPVVDTVDALALAGIAWGRGAAAAGPPA